MSWIAQAGRPIGKTAVRSGHGGGTRGGVGYHSDDEGNGGFMGGLPTYQSIPLCGPAMCGCKGMPPTPLPQPGISCVNRDTPCLPCDIINLQLRTSVAGVKMKRAVADAQKRYFCDVWNLLFSYMFPDHEPRKCPNLKAFDLESVCRPSRAAKKRRAAQLETPRLPYGIDPRRSMEMEDHPPPPPPSPPAKVPSGDRDLKVKPEPKQPLAPAPPPPPPPPSPPPSPSPPPPPPPPRIPQLRSRGGNRGGHLRYNIWTMPMPDASKENKSPGTQHNATKQSSNSNAYMYPHFAEYYARYR